MSEKYRTDPAGSPTTSGEVRNRTLPFALPDDEEGEDVFSSVPDDDEVLSSAPAGDGFEPWTPASAPSSPSTMPLRPVNRGISQDMPAVRRPSVTIESPHRPAQRVEITSARFLIGKGRADLSLDDPFVSKWHAHLFLEEGQLMLEDTGSHNGVYLRIADEFVLEDRDEIVVGQQRLLFRTSWDAPSQPPSHDRSVPTLGAPASNLPARLIRMIEAGHVGAVYPIEEGLSIGAQGADVIVRDDDLLSSPHAAIDRKGHQYYLRDLGSQYGTFIRIRGAVELIDGDCFVVGRTRLIISYP